MSHVITPGTLTESDARLLRTPYDRSRIGLPCESGRLNATNRHLLNVTQISDRVEVKIGRASEQSLPPSERRGSWPPVLKLEGDRFKAEDLRKIFAGEAAHQEYLRRATAETDRLPIALHIKPQPWRPLSDWRFLGCASLGLSIAAFGGYCVGLPGIATLCLTFAVVFCVRLWRFR
jgi:hypothetical protein